MMENPDLNFYTTQNEFNSYWENKTIEKGKGWKQFKRWENFIEPRVFPNGIFQPKLLFEEYQNLLQRTNLRTSPNSNSWSQLGPVNVPLESSGRKRGIGRVNSVVFHPTDPNTFYIGAPAGGLWKTINGGQTWTTSTDFLTNLGVSDIAIHPQNPDTIYIITGDRDAGDTYSYGLMKSYDGGLTFQLTGLSFNITSYYRGNRVLIDPNNPNILIVATSNGIYRSTDGGDNFVNTFSSANITSMEFHPTNSNIIYGGSKGNTSIYKSSNNGISWSQSGSGLPSTNSVVRACVAVTPANPSVVYALFGDNNNGFYALYKSTNEGVSWTQQSNSPNLLGWSTTGSDSDGQAWYDLALTVSTINEDEVFVGGVNCWKSSNSGVSWSLNTHWYGGGGANYMHADEHMLEYNPLNNYVYSANDGGLYVSTNHGNSWTDISDGLEITQFYSLGVSQTVQGKVITGSQDNGTFLRNNNNWNAVIGGDGMECIIDHSNANTMYGALYYGDIRKSTNGGNSFFSVGPANNGAWETPYVMDPNNAQILIAGYTELYRTTNGGNNWNTITNGETNGGKIDEIGLSKSNNNVIYFSDGPNIYKTTNLGANWSNITGSLPYRTISYIVVHPSDPDKVWITFSGYSNGNKVYLTEDGGQNWQNISGTLPNIPINCIVLDENSTMETLYIGSDLGVFTTDSTLSDWNLFNNNSLPNVIVTELEIQQSSNQLIAATYGRGLWGVDLQITSPPVADFSISDSVFCNVPALVNFTNTSYYSNSYFWDFGDGNTSNSSNPTHTYLNYGTYTVKLVATGPLGVDSVVYSSIINIDPGNPCIITLPNSGQGTTQYSCNGTLYDVGGPNGNYYDQNDSWITISPPGSNQVTLNFISFDIEAPSSSTYCNWDYLEIFDGPDTNSPSLGQYCNVLTGSPGTISSSNGSITVLLHADQAVNGTGFEASWTCSFPSAPPLISISVTDTLSCNGTIGFSDLSTNGPTSWLWDFGDGNTSNLQNPTHTYLSGGIYTITLIAANQFGSDTLTLINYIKILDTNFNSEGDTACGSSSLTLSTYPTYGLINWYDDSTASNLVYTGNTFTTPLLSNTKSYYARSEITYQNIFGGPNDNNFGGGSYYQGNRHLVFNNYTASKLVSVLVYSNSAGNRIIELRNSSNMLIADTNIYIPYSPNGIRLYLNFDLPVGNNMQLGINGQNSDLFRNNAGAVFPYNISNIVSITGTNASAGYYYFFYDWEIVKDPCYSNLIKIDAVIGESYIDTQNIFLCTGDTVVVGNNIYSTSGTYIDTFNIGLCDSVLVSNLSFGNSSNTIQSVNLCFGDTLYVGNNYYYNSGTYTDTIIVGSCDSIITTFLTINPQNTTYQSINICNGDSIILGSQFYYSTGTYSYSLSSINGCDSVIIVDLLVGDTTLYNNHQTICQSETYQIGNNIYSSPGNYVDIMPNIFGCDSVINTFLTVYPNTYADSVVYICPRDSFFIFNNTYLLPGTYTDTLINNNGCDSIFTTTINWFNSNNSFNILGDTLTSTGNQTYQIYPLNNSSNYQWVLSGGGVVTSGQNSSQINIDWQQPGEYSLYCIETDNNGCVHDTIITTIIVTDPLSNNINNLNEIIIYPNPTNKYLFIEVSNDNLYANLTVSLSNVLGKIVYSNKFIKNKLVKIDLSGIPSGIYTLNITNDNMNINKTIIHEK